MENRKASAIQCWNNLDIKVRVGIGVLVVALAILMFGVTGKSNPLIGHWEVKPSAESSSSVFSGTGASFGLDVQSLARSFAGPVTFEKDQIISQGNVVGVEGYDVRDDRVIVKLKNGEGFSVTLINNDEIAFGEGSAKVLYVRAD